MSPMTVWFTSDLHLGHRKVAEIRGFDSVEDHDDRLADQWASVVGPKDQVWVLGDIAASSPFYAFRILHELPGEKHLIWGNHDQGHPMNRNAHRMQQRYLGPFSSVAQSARRRIEGVEVLLSHFPYYRDRDEPRYMQWRLRNHGAWLLHGHTHGQERLSINDREDWWGDTHTIREIHVGVDAWRFTPVPMDTIGTLMARHR